MQDGIEECTQLMVSYQPTRKGHVKGKYSYEFPVISFVNPHRKVKQNVTEFHL